MNGFTLLVVLFFLSAVSLIVFLSRRRILRKRELSWPQARERMVKVILGRGVNDIRILDALRRLPRHLFLPDRIRSQAYDDKAVPIGYGQTISQPYVAAVMTERLHLRGADRVLEI